MRTIIVANHIKDIPFHIEGVEVIPAKTYLTDDTYLGMKGLFVYNLCQSYRYQSIGYYVSLLAEARGHKVLPKVTTIQDFKTLSVVRLLSDDIDELIQKSFAPLKSKEFTLSIYFGKNFAAKYEALCKQLYTLFQTPLLRAVFVHNKKWQLQNIAPIPLKEIPDEHLPAIKEFAHDHFNRKHIVYTRKNKYLYDVAILVNPKEKAPPSNEIALKKFIKAGASLGLGCELITKDDYNRLPEFDALFIRETTSVSHHTYRFSRRAHAEGMVVIDDPVSILKCTNKVYLAELLSKAKIPVPKTMIVHKNNKDKVMEELGIPCVLKQPDSSFSIGVIKVETEDELHKGLKILFDKSELVVAQEFLPTEYDWRIGVINKVPFYACKYFMAKGHWQIYNWDGKKHEQEGNSTTIPIEHVPTVITNTAKKAASLIGNGFYGVDIKQIENKAYVIEVNDNPSIDSGIEDLVLKQELYLIVMRTFLKQLEAQHQTM